MNSKVHELQFMNSKFMNLTNFLISVHELLMNCSRTIHEQFMIISLGLGRASLITTGGTTSSHRTLPNIGWPVQTSRTIHFNSKLHVYPSPDTLINPSTDRIHHQFHNIVHINVTIKKQFTTPVIHNNTIIISTVPLPLSARDKLTVSPLGPATIVAQTIVAQTTIRLPTTL